MLILLKKSSSLFRFQGALLKTSQRHHWHKRSNLTLTFSIAFHCSLRKHAHRSKVTGRRRHMRTLGKVHHKVSNVFLTWHSLLCHFIVFLKCHCIAMGTFFSSISQHLDHLHTSAHTQHLTIPQSSHHVRVMILPKATALTFINGFSNSLAFNTYSSGQTSNMRMAWR